MKALFIGMNYITIISDNVDNLKHNDS